jgi:DNA-binding MarR family transcriptional regulator
MAFIPRIKIPVTLMKNTESPQGDDIRAVTRALRQLILRGENFRQQRAHQLHLGKSDLSVVAHLCDEGPLTPTELSARMDMTSGTMTALLDRVEKAGFLSRNTNPKDRRSLVIRVTSAGEQAIAWIYGEFDSAIRQVITDSSEHGTDAAALLLEQLGEALSANTAASSPNTGDLRSTPHRRPRPI